MGSTPTGVCATLINGVERSLCTNLNAANNYKVDHCKQPEHWKVVEGAKIIYSAGFFVTVSQDSIKEASREQAKSDQIYCMNLSAPFLTQVPPFKACFVDTMPYVDFLFGNETEARTWAETQGWDPTVVAVNGHVKEYPVLVLPKEKLVDTNGAGDSYVGGFLAGMVKGLDIEACCKAGAYAASVIVQRSGCTFPEKPDYSF